MSHGNRGIVRIAILGLLASGPSAQESTEEAVAASLTIGDVPHTTDAVMIDGVLDDAAWRDALVIELDFETYPRENQPSPVETFAYLIEDGSKLFIAFDARDPRPDEIRAYLGDRDSVYNDDFVGVILDTFNDQRRAFEFFVNPLGVQMDLTMDDVNGGENDSWDAIWESAGEITTQGFIVEMAIPFSQLRFQRLDGPQTWGIDTLRFYPRADRVRMSAHPQERGRNCYLCQMDKIRGFANAEPGRGLEIVPSMTASRTDERDATLDELVDGDSESEVGVDVRWAVTPDMIANLALNPDFSQVEADIPQLDVNNQFALFFPETRPFFLEGANFFSTPINAVFTRTVADPDFGAKFTGTSDTNTIGLFAAEDAVTNLLFPGSQSSSSRSLDQSNETFVGRYQRGFGDNSAVGALVTTRSGDDYHNHVVGLDGRYRPNDRHSVRFQYLGSDTEYPDEVVTGSQQPAGTLTGDALHVNYNWSTRNWEAFANYRVFDPDFRADSGFVSQVDFENQNVGFSRTWYPADGRWSNRWGTGFNTGSSHTIDGQLLSRWREVWGLIEGPWQLFAQAGLTKNQQFWNGILYDMSSMWAYAQTRPVGGLNLGLEISAGDEIDFANSQLGEELRLAPWLNWNANRHLLVGLQLTSARVETQAGELIFDADLMDLRLTWQFNVRTFVRLTTQQQKVERNLAQFTDPDTDAHTESRGAQFLYSYQLNPQTVVYAGYSDNHIDNDDLDSLTKTDRTFFLKVSYAWIPG